MRWWEQEAIIEKHGDIQVVREDLVPGGSKIRFLPYLIEGKKEVVYGSPFCGGAAYALSEYGKREGVKISLFYAKRNEWHRRQKAASRNGANIKEVPYGYMTNVQSKARKYAEENDAFFLPLGFDLPEASKPFVDHMKKIRKNLGHIDQVWCATGSGMLARCLGEAFYPIPIKAVVVGLASKNSKQNFSENVSLIQSQYEFSKESKASSPFPSCGNYDRKAWEICLKEKEGNALFWNVLG